MLKSTSKLINPFRLKRKKPKKLHGFLVDEDFGTKAHREKMDNYFKGVKKALMDEGKS